MARNPKAAVEADVTVDKALDALDPALAHALRAQFQALKSEIADLSTTLAEIGRTGVDVLKEGATGAQTAAGEKLADARGEVEAYARDKPVQAMGMAAGLGLLLGLLLARR